jgi:hypothetical protein
MFMPVYDNILGYNFVPYASYAYTNYFSVIYVDLSYLLQ